MWGLGVLGRGSLQGLGVPGKVLFLLGNWKGLGCSLHGLAGGVLWGAQLKFAQEVNVVSGCSCA